MAITTIVMPNFGQTTDENTIACWLKSEGEWVERGDVLAEVETDKVTAQVEAYSAGFLRRILRQSPAAVAAGEPIALLSQSLDEPIDIAEMPFAGDNTNGAGDADRQLPEQTPDPRPLRVTDAAPPLAAVEFERRILATPMARQAARELQVDLRLVTGHGVGSRILLDDVQSQAGAVRDAMPADRDEGHAGAPDTPARTDGVVQGAGEYIELSAVRKITASRMLRSVQEAPQFAISVDVELAEAERLRARWDITDKNRPSYTALLVKVAAVALARHPYMNVAYEEGRLRRFRAINVGLAMATPRGLLVPVIQNADRLSLAELQEIIAASRAQAADGRLPPNAMGTAGFTISNLGMYGIDRFTAILNPPEVGILAVGRIAYRPISVGTAIESRQMVTLTLTVDHRAVDGAEAAVFLVTIRDLLQNPYLLI